MVKRDYIADIENAINKRTNPVELLNVILGFLNFKKVEIEIYNILLKSSLTIKEIEKKSNLSERTIRKHLKRLCQEGFITKKVKEDKRLKYVYKAVPVQEAWKKANNKIQRTLNEITKSLKTKSMVF